MTKMIIKDKAYAVDLLKQRVRHIQDELTETFKSNVSDWLDFNPSV